MKRLGFARDFDFGKLTWSRPDVEPAAICSYCSGALPEVPLMMWNSQGAAISLCNECTRRYIEVKR